MLVAGTASAQLSVNAGYLNGNVKTYSEVNLLGTKISSDTSASIGGGFYVGGSYNVSLIGGLGVAPGLYFNYLTDTEKETILGVNYTDKTVMMDINVPILINYRLTFGDDFAIFAFAGPNIRFGIVGDNKITNDFDSKEIEDNLYVKEGGETDAEVLKRFDLGLMVGGGLEFGGFRLEAGYNMGLLDRSAYKDDANTKLDVHINNFFVGVGYTF